MKKTGNYYGEIYKYTLKATEKSIANDDAGKCYIGQTGNTKKRQGDWDNQNSCYAGPKINEIKKKYPPEDWVREVLFSGFYKKKSTRKKKIDVMETAMIRKYDSVNNGFNTSYGCGMKGLHHSKESRQKISQALRGVKKSEAHKKAIAKGMKKFWKIRLKRVHKYSQQNSVPT